MPFFFLFFFFIVNIYANEIHIQSTFRDLHRICIYNKEGTTIKALLTTEYPYSICETLSNANGVIVSKCGYQKLFIKAQNLREKVVYYILNLWGENKNSQYKLKIYGSPTLWAGECPSDALAKIANTSPQNIAYGALLGGVFTGLIFFAGFAYALTPTTEHKED